MKIITMKLNFGSAGINPSLTIPGGLLAFIGLKTLTNAGKRLPHARRQRGLASVLFRDFTPQENAVVQAMISKEDFLFVVDWVFVVFVSSFCVGVRVHAPTTTRTTLSPSLLFNKARATTSPATPGLGATF